MNNEKRKKYSSTFSFLISLFSLLIVCASCGKGATPAELQNTTSPFASFRDIPGVTDEEITAIESLQKGNSLVFGTPLNTEAFIGEDGSDEYAVGGYIARYCDWLTTLFGIRFTPKIFVLSDMLNKLNSRELDFGILRGREELRKEYSLTDAIGQRMIIMMRIKGSEDLHRISMTRLPRYVFLQVSSTYDMVANTLASGTYEALFASNYEAGYAMLKNGEADALIEANVIEGAFEKYDDVYSENFLPLLFNPIVMITAKADLEPIISVVNKALQNGATPYLIRLYDEGYRDYMKHKMSIKLSDKEREYIASHPIVPVVAIYDNYPVCFYNNREGEWQGIFFDLFDEITAITEISFNIINAHNDDWPVIYEMARNGTAALAAEMVRTPEREAYFIWPETEVPPDYFALISKSDYRDLTINEIMEARVGLARNTVFASTFKYWFPDHAKTVEYENMNKAVSALQRGEVDLVMSTQGRLMFVTHFLELPGYKTNIVFDQPLQSISAVNKNEEVLCSIIDKALRIIDTKGISERWMRKTHDYRAKVAEARLPWLIGATLLSLIILSLLLAQFYQSRNEGKRLAKLVADQTEDVRNASEAKSHFIANMNHEMRTPMNVIVGLTGLMLEETSVPGNIREMLKKISTAGSTLMGLINDVLDISKIEAGKLELMPVEYDVAGLLNDILILNLIRIEGKPIIFILDIDENLPSVLLGDDMRVKQILNNLLSNAFKYTKKGNVTLNITCSRDGNRHNDPVWVSFCISDTGIGIREEDIPKLFIDYNQVDSQVNREIEGTGLGLSITKKFIEMMSGEISVESEYGKGSIFRVRIRQDFVTDKPIDEEVKESLRHFSYSDNKQQEQAKLERPDLSYARVLVVDDFPSNLDVAVGMLRKYKIQVDCVSNGQDAIDCIAIGLPVYDAVFMDHMMPEMDGVEATKKIRSLGTKYAENLTIIALTANAIAGAEQIFLNNGFNAFLPKPFNIMNLDSIVQRWIRKKG